MPDTQSSHAALQALLEQVKADETLRLQFASAGSLDAVLDLVAQQGIDVTPRQLLAFAGDDGNMLFEQDLAIDEISDEQLGRLAGGSASDRRDTWERFWN